MRYIKPYVNNVHLMNIHLPNYTDLIINEVNILNLSESVIPDHIRFKLELNLLLEGGFREVNKYHRNLIKGKNALIDSASRLTSKAEFNRINESYKNIIKQLKSHRVNEDDSEITDVFNSATTSNTSSKSLESGQENDIGILSTLKSLFNALTEGGTPIGILHLILDVIGLFGDFFTPVGMIADIINALIYVVRATYYNQPDKWILAILSIISAAIPVAGNAIKGMFQASKVSKVTTHLISSYIDDAGHIATGGTKVSDEALILLAQTGPKGTEALKYISKQAKAALPMAKRIIDTFFKDFLAKVVGWIPGIGAPLEKFFKSIADAFDIFFTKSTKFADDVPEIIEKSHVKHIDSFFKAAAGKGTEIVADGQNLLVKNSRGAFVTDATGNIIKLDASTLKGGNFLSSRYGPDLADAIGQKYIGRTENNIANFYKGLGDNLKHISSKYGSTFKIGKASFTFNKKLVLFIGKEITKYVIGDNKSLGNESELIGAISINEAIQNRISRNLKDNPDAAWDVPILDASDNEGSFELLNGYLNEQAKMMNLPEIGIVAYARNRKKDEVPSYVKEYWNTVYDDQENEVNKAELELKDKDVNIGESLKYIKRFKL